jgi:carbon-monoxide dehydrogenase medium subunit
MRFPDGKTNIAFTGVSENAFRDRNAENEVSGKELNEASISTATSAAVSNVTVLGDHFASAEYRNHLAKMYLKKALEAVM